MDRYKISKYNSNLLSANMYIIEKNNRAIVIDPCLSQQALQHIKNDLITIDHIILTHEHYDHISGVNIYKESFGGTVMCNEECGEAIQSPSKNFSKHFNVLMEVIEVGKSDEMFQEIEPYYCKADITFKDRSIVQWMGIEVELISTPGHSKGSICVLIDEKYLFSGDSLLKNYATVTKLKGGSRKMFEEFTIPFLKSLPPSIVVYPGHYESFYLSEKVIRQ